MIRTLQQLRWSVRQRGFAGTLSAAAAAMLRRAKPQQPKTPHPFDAANGTDTGGLIPGSKLASGHAHDRHIAGYAAVPPSRFRGIMERWRESNPPHALAEYCFLDLGCGKGRALLLAAEAGFREVVGVELSPSLAGIAARNVAAHTAAGKVRCPVRIEQKDVLELEWPAGPCVAFLFNPFDGELMQQLARRMAVEFRGRPDELEVLYYKAEHSAAFAEDFEMIWCEAIEIDAEELAADPVADRSDQTRAYRLARRER